MSVRIYSTDRKKLLRTWGLVVLTTAICACKSNPSSAQNTSVSKAPAKANSKAPQKPSSQHDLAGPPGLEEWVGEVSIWNNEATKKNGYSHALRAERFKATVYARPSAKAHGYGSARQGSMLWGRPTGDHSGCRSGWFELVSGGYACASGSFRPAQDQGQEQSEELLPEAESAIPYDYVRVADKSAWRFDALPSAEQLAQAQAGQSSDATDRQLDGDYFLAIIGEVDHEGTRFLQTLDGKFVRAEVVVPTAKTNMRGKLVANPDLQLAFVIDEDVVTYAKRGGKWSPAGVAAKYARFEVHERVQEGALDLVVDKSGVGVPRASARIAAWITPPSEVGASERWVHVDLAEQVLTAYEGETPKMVTLISSGKEGYDTPTGLFRIKHKHLTTTMSGDDPVEGYYEVGEVPWTMYYYKSFALHGAYWHDTFGRVRSHGCTNIPPADARWLMEWTSPTIPDGWHSVRAQVRDDGSYVYLTRDARP